MKYVAYGQEQIESLTQGRRIALKAADRFWGHLLIPDSWSFGFLGLLPGTQGNVFHLPEWVVGSLPHIKLGTARGITLKEQVNWGEKPLI